MAYEVFISCSKQDQPLCQKLDNHLANLKRQSIKTFCDDGISQLEQTGDRKSCSVI